MKEKNEKIKINLKNYEVKKIGIYSKWRENERYEVTFVHT